LGATWAWPIDVMRYDRTVELRPAERQEIGRLLALRPKQQTPPIVARFVAAERLVRPLRDVTQSLHGPRQFGWDALIVILRWCLREERAFWGWGEEGWARLIGPNQGRFCVAQGWPAKRSVRSPVIAAGYLLGQVIDFGRLGQFYRDQVAIKVFGRDLFEARALEVMDLLAGWGYRWLQASTIRNAAAELLLIHRSPRWQDVTAEVLQRLHQDPATRKDRRYVFYTLSRALAAMGVIEAPLHHLEAHPNGIRERSAETAGIAPEWAELVTRWQQTSVLTPLVRKRVRLSLLRAGRWLGDKHPEVTRPGQWDRQLAAEFVAAMDHMRVGDYVWMRSLARGAGQPMSARTKAGYLGALRTFFHDVRDWGWADLRFDPGRVFATPRTWRALMGPEPRVIADDIWAKLLWAGLNLQPGDMVAAGASGGHHPGKRPRGPHEYYPFELVRALAMVWLFAGLRSDEIMRLRQGCARWQMASGGQGAGGSPAARRICLLDVPVNKTGPAFTKPVDALVGEAVQAWEGVRPDQPDLADPKTGELVPLLFCYRARRVAKRYLNQILIPRLCRKAGVPTSDARGSISSHRARATIASLGAGSSVELTLPTMHVQPGTGYELRVRLGTQVDTIRLVVARG
jgi:hypothetical protein